MKITKLPKSFCGYCPLYSGTELAIGISVLNKCSGAYGILAVVTGHPLDPIQWILYIWSIICLVIFAQGLYQTHKPNLLTLSQLLVIFTADTLITFMFTTYFSIKWQLLEDRTDVPDTVATSQGASHSFELAMTIVITAVTVISRIYFNCIIASYVQELLHRPTYLVDQDDVDRDLKNQYIWKRYWLKHQSWCYHICKRVLA